MRATGAASGAVLLALLALACAPDPPVALEPVPHPDAGRMATAVQEQIAQRRAAVEVAQDAAKDAAKDDTGAEAADAWGELGRAYHAYGFHQAAAACYRNARALAPREGRWAYLLGYLYQLTGEPESSLAALREARELGIDHPAVDLRLGEVLLDLGRPQEAAEPFRRALEGDPDIAAAHYGLGRSAAALGDHAAARDHFLRALDLAPGEAVIRYALGASYRELGKLDRARAELDRAAPGTVGFPDPEKRTIEELARGTSARLVAGSARVAAGDLTGAETEFRRAVGENPDDPQARFALGSALAQLDGRADEARRELAAAVRLAPDDPALLSKSGVRLATLGDLDRAVELQRQALELAPGYVDARVRLGRLLALQGDHRAAEAELTAALERDPQELAARFARGLSRLRLERAGEAEQDFRTILAARSGHLGARRELADLLARRGDLKAAESAYREALDLDLDDRDRAFLLFRLGLLIGRRGDHDQALASFDKALELDPGYVPARFNLGVSLNQLGRHDEAAEQFRHITAAEPQSAAAWRGLASAHGLAGRHREALRALESGLAAVPEGEDRLPLEGDLVRLLASSADPGVRDGERALDLAGELFEAQGSPQHAELVAMALAAAGRFDDAADWQRRLVDLVTDAGGGAALPALEANLARYRRGETCCAPP